MLLSEEIDSDDFAVVADEIRKDMVAWSEAILGYVLPIPGKST